MSKLRTSTSTLYSQTMLLVGAGLLLILLGGAMLSYFKTIDLIHEGQNQSNNELAEGLAHSLTDAMVTRDYGGLESQIKLILLNKNLYSVLVTDINGNILAYLERKDPSGPIVENFHEKTIQLPKLDQLIITDSPDDLITIWKQIESGMAVGWLRLKITESKIDAILSSLKYETIMIASLVAIVIIAMLTGFLLRIYPKLYRNDLRIEKETRDLEFDALHDPLTQLPNRKLLLDRLQQAIFDAERKSNMLVVVFIDLDGFKEVNDLYGHEVGDQVLLEVRNRLLASFRRTDTVSRLGGDEFVVLLQDANDWAMCEKLLKLLPDLLGEPYPVNGHHITGVGASLGVSIYPRDGLTPEILISRADMAMYAAKRAGKGRLRSFSDMDIITNSADQLTANS